MPRRKDNPEERRILDAVDTLVEFANLAGGADVTGFLERHGDFTAPQIWQGRPYQHDDSGAAVKTEPIWRMEQDALRKAWRKHFPPELSVLLISRMSKYSPFEQSIERVFKMSSEELQKHAAAVKAKGQSWMPTPDAYPYQQAVMYMATHPERAKICERCKSYFVSDHHLRRFCSIAKPDQLTCYAAHRKEYKRKDGQAHNYYRD